MRAFASFPVSRPADHDETQARRMADRVLRDDASLDTRPRQAPASTVGSASGRPLDETTRSYFEPRFGFDFSGVRIHADAHGDRAARSVNARAFALGGDLYFREGEFNPASASGRRLLAHELAHVTQPGPPAIHREPGKDADDSWTDLVISESFRGDEKQTVLEKEAIRRFRETTEGDALINDLWNLFCQKGKRCKSAITINFVEDVGKGSKADTNGRFEPEWPDQPQYDIFIKHKAAVSEDERSGLGLGSYPHKEAKFNYTHKDAESDMANTLHHELTHVWFIHTHRDLAGKRLETGHDVKVDLIADVHDDFLKRLEAFSGDIDGVEARIRAEAAAARLKEEEQQRLEEEQKELTAPEPARRPPPAPPRRLGGQVFAQGGVISLGGKRGTAIAGADIILGRIASLRIGGRGLYLTPSHLLAGGAIGFRKLQGETGGPFGDRVENPLFFDIEAGVLAEITSGEAERITNRAAFTGALSIGQERGRIGSRLYWQVGAFVVVTDRGDAGGGVTGGVGGRF